MPNVEDRTNVGQDGSVGIATRYGVDGPGNRIPVGSRSSAPVQTGPGTHPASRTMVPVLFQGVKRPGRGVNYPPSSSAEVKDRVELYLFPLWDFMTCSGQNLHFTIINIVGTASWTETEK